MGSQFTQLDVKKLAINEFQDEFAYLQNMAELKLYQIELQQQCETIKATSDEITTILEKYHNLYQIAPVGFFTLDENGLIIETNEMGAKSLGLARERLINQCFSRYIAPEFHFNFSHFRQEVLKSDVENVCETKLLKRNGPSFYACIASKAICNTSGKKEILCVVTTLSNRNNDQLQEAGSFERSEDNNTFNSMLTNIVHELNHPLAVITNFVQGAIRRLENEKFEVNQVIEALKKALQQSDRLSDLILRMKNFNDRGNLTKESININNLLKETIELIQYETLGFPATVLLRPCSTNFEIQIDKIHIQQVIINLARNAIESMKDAGTSSPKVIIECSQIAKDFLEVSVIDNGPGFDKETTHKLLSPGFTTKPYGIGLGLTIARKMIEAHGGKLFIELNTTDGACFKFTLPLGIAETV